MLDNLPPAVQHLLLSLAAAVLSVLAANVDAIPLPDGVKALAGAALPVLVAYLTTLTRQYGVGATPEPDNGAEDVG